MHQTTVRFGADLWESLEEESARLGISVAHFVRDAALARLAYTAGFDDGSRRAGGIQWAASPATSLAQRVVSEISSSDAVRAQGELARERARLARAEAERLRRHHRELQLQNR
jgi:hypothetical protein